MSRLAPDWRKSSRSSNQTNCVEIRCDLAAVRDSKDPSGGTLAVCSDGVRALVRAAHQFA